MMLCPNCGGGLSRCPECGDERPIGSVATCDACDCPVDCAGCLFTVSDDLKGVLKPANDDT